MTGRNFDIDIIKTICLICLLAICSAPAFAQSKTECGESCITAVKNFINESRSGFSSGVGEKLTNRLGDKVSVSLENLYDQGELRLPEDVEVSLRAVEAAFAYPDLIVDADDKTPRRSLEFLYFLSKQTNDIELKRKIETTIDHIFENSGEILLEARYIGVGMAAPYGNLLIARIDKHGNIEFEDQHFSAGVLTREMKSAVLPKGEIADLKKILADENILGLNEDYDSIYPIIDAARVLTLRLLHDGKLKVIHVVNFTPDHAKASSVYPKQLINLARIADCARPDAETHFFFDAKECK